ncbi:MAG: preprotein translocase subunit YajC [Gammaproteobacteria bacterium]|jgi:preprotein translocase subunit YajC|nr:preprotein translocase subunit YajC [Gammaproteobacteria bacterium]
MSILNLFGITDAMAQQAPPETAVSSLMSSLPIFIIFIAVFYFLLIRPQSKRAKEHRKLIDALAKDDEVITTGGLTGKVVDIQDTFVVVKVSKDVNITFQKNAIAAVVPKGTFNI